MEHQIPELRTVNLVRYLQPFREGGSLPALAEADDGFKYVIKFRGAGQGPKALIADFIGGIMAKYVGLNVPELVAANLDESFGRTEPDEEIQDLLKASTGLNLGVHFLEGAVTFDPAVKDKGVEHNLVFAAEDDWISDNDMQPSLETLLDYS